MCIRDRSLGTLTSTNYALTAANGALNVFAPINMGTTAVGTPVTQPLSFQVGPASTFASVLGSTKGNGASAFHADGFSCSAGTCSGTLTFTPRQPGTWTGAYELLSQSSPPSLLLSIPATGTGTGPQMVFNPAEQTTIGTGLSEPQAVAVDSSGNTYIADESNNRAVSYTHLSESPLRARSI